MRLFFLNILKKLHDNVRTSIKSLSVDIFQDIVRLGIIRRLLSVHANQRHGLHAMLLSIARRTLAPIHPLGMDVNSGRLRSLAYEPLHTRRARHLFDSAFSFEIRQAPRAERLKVHDDGATHVGGMVGQECLDAPIARQIGTKSDKPHFGIDISCRNYERHPNRLLPAPS